MSEDIKKVILSEATIKRLQEMSGYKEVINESPDPEYIHDNLKLVIQESANISKTLYWLSTHINDPSLFDYIEMAQKIREKLISIYNENAPNVINKPSTSTHF